MCVCACWGGIEKYKIQKVQINNTGNNTSLSEKRVVCLVVCSSNHHKVYHGGKGKEKQSNAISNEKKSELYRK